MEQDVHMSARAELAASLPAHLLAVIEAGAAPLARLQALTHAAPHPAAGDGGGSHATTLLATARTALPRPLSLFSSLPAMLRPALLRSPAAATENDRPRLRPAGTGDAAALTPPLAAAASLAWTAPPSISRLVRAGGLTAATATSAMTSRLRLPRGGGGGEQGSLERRLGGPQAPRALFFRRDRGVRMWERLLSDAPAVGDAGPDLIFRRHVAPAVARIVAATAGTQAAKGILTAGIATAALYAWAKVSKFARGSGAFRWLRAR
jgi:hypothetical protein